MELAGQKEVVSKKGMVSSAHVLASQAGALMLERGGNAVDAAVASAFAIGVAEPFTSGIGGGGFMLVRMAQAASDGSVAGSDDREGAGAGTDTAFIDYREVAPGAASPDMYTVVDGKVVGRENEIGYKAAAVPGSVAGMALALRKYGTKTLAETVEPAAEIAEKGFSVGPFLRDAMVRNAEKLRRFPAASAIYLKDGRPYEVGETLFNRDYARTLRLIGEKGPDVFYRGEIAEALAREMQLHGGLVNAEDLDRYVPSVRHPVSGTYRGYDLISSPPPSSGGTHVIEILNMLEGFDVRGMGHGSLELKHLLAAAFGRAFADREAFMGDPAFVDIPLTGLLSKTYARDRIADFDPARATLARAGRPNGYESHSTTHLSAMDASGNVVSLTQTVEGFFGCGAVLPGYGFILNDEMHDLDPVPGGPNSIAPRKKPLSSMSPTIVLKEGRPFLAVGSPGSKRIITAVAQVLSNVIDHGMGIQQAVDAPRIHTEGDVLHLESPVSSETREGLLRMGYQLNVRGAVDYFFGGAHGVLFDEVNREFRGGADPRREGRAVGV